MIKIIKTFSIIIFIFFLGILTERFEYDKKVASVLKNIFDSTARSVHNLFPKDTIQIIIDQKDYKKIFDSRKQAIEKGILLEEAQKWVNAKLIHNELNRDIEIRLKGVFPDHWSDSNRWSFKIKIKRNSKPFNETNRFNLQTPETSSYMYEWLLMKALEQENLINLETKYYDLEINGKNLGAYMFQDGISDELLKKNKKELGPIVGFSKDLFLKEYLNSERINKLGATGSLNGIEDNFWRERIEPTQFSKDKFGKIQEKYLNEAILLLESFRREEKKINQIFDVKKLSKVMALRALLGSSEFDYRDTKFYYNPSTKLLEPITKESHVDLNFDFKKHYFSWWIDSTNIKPHRPANKSFFLDIFYNDLTFHELYLNQLNEFSKKKYFQNLITNNKAEFNEVYKIIKSNYPSKKIFSSDQLEINRIRIQDLLNPILGVNVYFSSYNQNILKLNISNLQRLPIKIIGIELEDGNKILVNKNYTIRGKKPQLPTTNILINFDCKFKDECKKAMITNQKLLFQVLGQKKIKKTNISLHNLISE